MLQPKRVKYRKSHKGRRRGKAQVGNTVVFGDFGLQALESVWLTSRQIEAARRAITHHIRRGGNVWIRVFPDKPVTRKAAETRMGGGKGAPDHWVAVVKRGRSLFEMAGFGGGLVEGRRIYLPEAGLFCPGDKRKVQKKWINGLAGRQYSVV